MFVKLVVLLSVFALCHCGVVPVVPVNTDYDHNPMYTFAYKVQDSLTGDNKSREETRDGDVVRGSYSIVEPDGNVRTVLYTADPINGFQAVVQRAPLVHHVKPAVAVPARLFG